MLVERVPDIEFCAFEQAILAAERQHKAAPRQPTSFNLKCAEPTTRTTIASAACAKANSGDSKKRKLPQSFAQPDNCQNVHTQAAELHYTGQIVYVYTAVEVDYHCKRLLKEPQSAVGFDIEWRVTYKAGEAPRKTALLQLCSKQLQGQYQCLLLHIAHSGLTPALIQLLQSQEIKKVGVGISGDAHKLQRDFGVPCAGLICLSDEANVRLCSPANGRAPQKWSLAGLTQELLHLSLDKGSDIRCSNWEVCPLSAQQKAYAANDAYAAIKVYQVLRSLPIIAAPPKVVETPPAPWPATVEAAEVLLTVPGQAELLPLQPSKLAIFKLFTERGMSMDAIASQRTLQLGTVQSYIAEAMAAGYGYPWHRMGVPHCILVSLCDHVRAYHRQLMQQQEPEQLQQAAQSQPHSLWQELQQEPKQPQGHTVQQHCIRDEQQQHVLHRQQHDTNPQQQPLRNARSPVHRSHTECTAVPCTAPASDEHEQLAVSVASDGLLDDSSCSAWMLTQAQVVCRRCGLLQDQGNAILHGDGSVHVLHGNRATGACPQAVQLPELGFIRELVLTGKGTKALRDSMHMCAMTYGHMRLSLAHVYCLLRNTICPCRR